MNHTIFKLGCLLFLVFSHFTLLSQCPESFPGYHRVIKGETLYKISKKYKVSIDQLCEWNNIAKTAPLTICQELAISTPKNIDLNVKTDFKAVSNMAKQEGGKHIIQEGETIAGIAEIYGFTEKRFRRINGLSQSEPAWPGLVLRSSDCFCNDPVDDSNGVIGSYSLEGRDSVYNILPRNREKIPSWDEFVSSNEYEPENDNKWLFGEDPFYQESSLPAQYRRNKANSSSKNTYRQNTTKSETSAKEPATKAQTPTNEGNETNKKTNPSYSAKPDDIVSSPTNSYKATNEELDMIREINLVRANPLGYVRYIELYKKEIASGTAFGSVESCDDLIAELKRTSPLSPLITTDCLIAAAKKHGDELKQTGSFEHVGKDGSYPWDRIRKACRNLTDGNENLVGGAQSIRKSIILLLVDDGIPGRGHRKNILSKEWKYVACYKVGKIGDMQNNWVQNFGK